MRKILDVVLYNNSSKKPDILQGGTGLYHRYAHPLRTENTWLTLFRSFFIPKRLSNYSIIITHEYFSSFAVNLRLLVTFCRTKHLTVGLNQSRRLLKTGIGLVDQLIDCTFRRCDRIIVHSRREMVLFSEIHAIPPDRFCFSLWGFDLPHVSPGQFSSWPRPFVCLVGRNNRDIGIFIQALAGMAIDGILITANYQAVPEGLPPNIHVFRDLPSNDTLDCITHAIANLVVLKDNDRGAGHITAVAAMLAGTPQIFSDIEAMRDYLVHDVSAIGIGLGDGVALRRAIEKLLANPALGATLSANAKSYAERWLTHREASRRILAVLDSLSANAELPSVDPQWLVAFEEFGRRPMNVDKEER